MTDGKCGLNEYADSRGIARGTFKGIVKDAVTRAKNGIVHGYDEANKKVYPEILDKEWFNRYRIEQMAKGKTFLPKASKAVTRELQAGTGEADGMATTPEWKVVKGAPTEHEEETAGSTTGVADYFGFKDGIRPDFIEAQRVWMINKARRERMEADEKQGLLVKKSEIEGQLTTAGMEIRKAFERLPMRVIDGVLAAKGRGEVVQVIEDMVRTVLEEVTETIKKVIGGDAEQQQG